MSDILFERPLLYLQCLLIIISNHMAGGVIWDISPALFLINFEINPSVSEGDLKIDKKITRVLYSKFHVVKLAG